MKTIGLLRPILKDQVNFPLVPAPMVAISHAPWREIIRLYLPKNCHTLNFTEMLSSRRLNGERLGLTPHTLFFSYEKDLVPQISGGDKEHLATTIKKLEGLSPLAIDFNMGCPVPKALQNNYGAALLKNPQFAAEMVKTACQLTAIPISAKIRTAQGEDINYVIHFVQQLVEAGLSWITYHPRDELQKRRGSADWSLIKKLREQISIPVIGNGDVQTVDDALAMFAQTDCDLVMVGRALMARPWMLWQMGERLGLPAPELFSGKAPHTPSEEGAAHGEMLLQLLNLMEKQLPAKYALEKFKFFVRICSPWLEYGNLFYGKVTGSQDFPQMQNTIINFFKNKPILYQKTDLRF